MSDSFEEADKVVHPVEKQWHYEILTQYGFIAKTKEAIGFVRTYIYEHPSGNQIEAHTGYNSDYWCDKARNKQGYWVELEPYLKSLVGESK